MDEEKDAIIEERKETVANTRRQITNTGMKMSSRHNISQCMDCGKSFTRRSSLIVHQRIHTGEKLFMCSECGKSFGLKSSLVRHLKTHTPKTLKICPVCGKCFSRFSSLFQHQKVHLKDSVYRCSYCEKSFPRASQLVVHQRVHKQRPLSDGQENVTDLDQLGTHKHFVCLVCGKYFKEQRFLTRHQRIHKESSTIPLNHYDGLSHDLSFNVNEDYNVPQASQEGNPSDQVKDGSFHAKKEIHRVRKQVVCIECGKSFTRKSSLVVHQRTHTGEKLFMCIDCGKRFSLKSSLVRHIRTHCPKKLLQHKKVHRKEKPYKCPLCEKSFSQSSQLAAHERTHKAEMLSSKSEPKNSDSLIKANFKDAKGSHKCLECGRIFRRKATLLKHQRIYKGNSCQFRAQNRAFRPITESDGNGSTSAPAHKDDEEALVQDLTDVPEKLNSSIDKKSYIGIRIGDKTVWKSVSEAKSITCTECGKSFTRKASLMVHQRTHTGEKLFVCTDCGTRFSLKSSLVRHMRSHCSKMLNICSECGKCFSCYSSLFQHQKVHRKERTHKCPQCEKSFSRASQLVLHRKTHKLEKSYLQSEPGENTDELGKPNCYVIDNCAEEPRVCLESGAHSSHQHHQKAHRSVRGSCSYTNPDYNDDAGKTLPESSCEKHKSQDGMCNVVSTAPEAVKMVKHECAKSDSICNPRSSSISPYHCIQCGKNFTRKSTLIIHQKTHTGEKLFICTDCGKRFSIKSSLDRHQKNHTGPSLNICSDCGIYFSRYCDLLLHLEAHMSLRDEPWKTNVQQSLNEDKDGATVEEENKSNLIPKEQQLYEKGFFSNDNPDSQESSSIKQETSENPSAESRDELCKNNVQQSLNEDKDGATVEKKNKLNLIQKEQQFYEKGFFSNDNPDSQGSSSIKQEASENPFADDEPTMSQKNEDECTDPYSGYWENALNPSDSTTDGCSRKTDETKNHSEQPILNVLNKHNLGHIWKGFGKLQRSSKSTEKSFFCLECGKSFTRNFSLVVHQRIHTGEKLFMCTECGRRFGLKSSLVRHMRTHNTERFNCVACGRSFRDYSKFLEHQANHHSGELPA